MLSAMGPALQPYLWWKKYLTQLQLVSFFIILLHITFHSIVTKINLFSKAEHLVGIVTLLCTSLVTSRPLCYLRSKETLSLAGKEHRLRVFENRVLRIIFGPKWAKVTGDWEKLHNEELHNVYSPPNTSRLINQEALDGQDM
jgi:hypothetical protein